MARPAETISRTAKGARRGALRAFSSGWLQWLPRVGYLIRGALYALVGVLALMVALGKGGKTTGLHGAISTLAGESYGKILLIVIAVGLFGYSLWGFIRAILDPLGRGTNPKGIVERIGFLVSGVVYAGLFFTTLHMLTTGPDSGAETANRDLTARLMQQPWGHWVVVVAGVVAIGGSLGQFFQAIAAGFMKDFDQYDMNSDERKWAEIAGRVGYGARGVVFAMLGFFLLMAGWNSDPGQAKGLDGALSTLAQEPYGPYLLGVVAAGLIAFGIYSMLCARWADMMKTRVDT